jgi:enediyne biosynthesis protein E4
MDLIATNISHPRYQPWSDITQLLRNEGGPDFNFTEVREEMGVHYDEGDVNASFADWDNDGDLDLLISSLYPGHFATLFRNDGDTFVDVTYEAGIWVHDAVSNAWSDVDGDGDLDVIVADRRGAPYVQLFTNNLDNGNHSVQLVLEGTTTNVSAIGARVSLTTGDTTQIREVKGGGGHSGNQQSMTVHFGLGDATEVDTLTVRWVGGETETFTGVEGDGLYWLVEGAGVAGEL